MPYWFVVYFFERRKVIRLLRTFSFIEIPSFASNRITEPGIGKGWKLISDSASGTA